jgi:hypothetical protein
MVYKINGGLAGGYYTCQNNALEAVDQAEYYNEDYVRQEVIEMTYEEVCEIMNMSLSRMVE